jgi:predicted AlkP superfamily phosphohydrolase/phosphomutase
MENSVLIIGIDGATWDLLKPWIDEGKLPTLGKFLKKGVDGKLKTTIPILSCSAWTSLFTGKNPGKHGIFEYVNDSGDMINCSYIKTEKIWQILSHYKKRCAMINVPMTYPVEELNGYMVSGILTPSTEKIYSYPAELMNVLKKHNYKIRVRSAYGKHNFLPNDKSVLDSRESYLKELDDLMDRRYHTLKEFMDENWDFFMVVFGHEVALLQTLFWDKKEIMLEVFRKLDLYIADLIKIFSIKNTNPYIFFVSDHGFSASPTRSINMKVLLEENGILKDNRTTLHKIIPKIYKKLNNIIPLSNLILHSSKTKTARESFQRKLTTGSNIYYKYPGVYIKQGLDETKYAKLRDKLLQELKKLQDPLTKDKVFQVVEKREDMYSGKYSELAPDVVTLSTNKYDVIFSYDSDKLFDDLELPLKGKHSSDLHGIFMAGGKEVKLNTTKHASILDIFPTVLHILDVPLPKELDGKVLKDIFKEDSSLFNKEISYSEEATKTIKEKSDIQDTLQDINF